MDLLPTVLTVLGLPVPEHVQGRILMESLSGTGSGAPPEAVRETVTAEGVDGYRACLAISRVGDTPYLDCGWVERR